MLPPSVEHALQHYRAVGPRRVALLCHLRHELSLVDFKPLKVVSVAHASGLPKRAIGPDLRQLASWGYLEQGPRAYARGPFTYRMAWPAPSASATRFSKPVTSASMRSAVTPRG